MATWIKISEYRTENITVRFEPVSNVPGFSYRAAIIKDGLLIAKDWLAEGLRPSEKIAECYLEKHARKLAAPTAA